MIPIYLISIANHLWQTTIFTIVIAILTLAFRRNRAAVRHGLWLVASMKFLIPFAVFMSLGSQFHWPARTQSAALPIPELINKFNEPFSMPATPVVPRQIQKSNPDRLPFILGTIWLFGAGSFLFGWVNQWRRLHATLSSSRRLDLHLDIPVVSSHDRIEPGVFGIFRPVLVIPESMSERLPPEQLQAIIGHELCHVRRRDNLTSAIHMCVETAFWFHPFTWWIGKQLLAEQEAACDEAVLHSGTSPQDYAQGILKVCEICVETGLPCVSGVTGASLKQRIAGILNNQAPLELTRARVFLLAFSAVLFVSAPLYIGAGRIAISQPAAPPKLAQLSALVPPPQPFDVVSVKENKSSDSGWELTVPSHGYIRGTNVTLMYVMQVSYHVQTPQVIGAPDWITSKRFDFEAKGLPTATGQQVYAMVRVMLADRFKLQTHIEKKELPIYSLVVSKGGPKLGNPADGPCKVALAAGQPCGDVNFNKGVMVGWNMTSQTLANNLGRLLADRPVVDNTGIPNRFDLTLRWQLDATEGPQPDEGERRQVDSEPSASLFAALQQQAGLRLEPAKGVVEVLVIDHVEMPMPNGK